MHYNIESEGEQMYAQNDEIISKEYEVEDLIINTKYEDLPTDGIFTIEDHEFPFETFDIDARDFLEWDDFYDFINEKVENDDYISLCDLYKVADIELPAKRERYIRW